MTDLVTFGEVLWDVIDGDAHIGGAPFNLAAHAVRCGLSAAVVSRVGDDNRGYRALDEMQQLGVENKWTAVDRTHPTGTVTVTLKGRTAQLRNPRRCGVGLHSSGAKDFSSVGIWATSRLLLRHAGAAQ
jgi:hypothetical protein